MSTTTDYNKDELCKKIELHVLECSHCQRRLAFNPVEKSLLKTYSVKNEIIELIAYISLGIFLIFILSIFQK